MKFFFNYVISFLIIFNVNSSNVLGIEKESIHNKSQLEIASNYAERFCNAKENNFFEGLDNEKTLKYSYFRYIGFLNEEIYSKDMHKQLIQQIREKCLIENKEEREIIEFFSKSPQD